MEKSELFTKSIYACVIIVQSNWANGKVKYAKSNVSVRHSTKLVEPTIQLAREPAKLFLKRFCNISNRLNSARTLYNIL